MSTCPNCNKKVKKGTANKKKVRGIFIHKECPDERLKKKALERRKNE